MTTAGDSIQNLPTEEDEQILRTSQLGVRFPDGKVAWAPANTAEPRIYVDGTAYNIGSRLDGREMWGNEWTFTGLVSKHRKARAQLSLPVDPDGDPVRVTRNLLVILDEARVTDWVDPS